MFCIRFNYENIFMSLCSIAEKIRYCIVNKLINSDMYMWACRVLMWSIK